MKTTITKSKKQQQSLIRLLLYAGVLSGLTFTNLFSQTVTFTSSGTWTVPAGMTEVFVNVWGGGGGGGGGYGGCSYDGNGGVGGGGGFAQSKIAVIPGQIYTITVGAGGAGGAAGASHPGGAGGTSTFTGNGVTVSATGGAGGAGGNCSTNAAGGVGGIGTVGTIIHSGGTGSYGTYNSYTPTGTGGGGAGSGSDGSSPANGSCISTGGAGGTGIYPGGDGAYNPDCSVSTSTLAGAPGALPAGGGSGPAAWGSVAGGSGASGKITIVDSSVTTGIASRNFDSQNEIYIFPNPFNSATTISFSSEQKNTTIYMRDVLGKQIKTQTFSGKEFIIEKGELSNGIYFVQIMDENKMSINKKIVVQ